MIWAKMNLKSFEWWILQPFVKWVPGCLVMDGQDGIGLSTSLTHLSLDKMAAISQTTF